MNENELERLRLQIDDVDSEILNLLSKRSDIVSEIGEHKLKKSAVVDLNREEMILNRLLNKAKANYSNDTIIRIWRELFEASSKLQISKNSSIETKRSISGIKPYKGGQSSLKGNSKIIKLSSNENSHGSSPKILQKLEIKLLTTQLLNYKLLHQQDSLELHFMNEKTNLLSQRIDLYIDLTDELKPKWYNKPIIHFFLGAATITTAAIVLDKIQ